MDLTTRGSDSVRDDAPLVLDADRHDAVERFPRLRRAPLFSLDWLDVPNDVGRAGMPLGTCLVLRCTGGRVPENVVVELADGDVRRTDALGQHSELGIATPLELTALVDIGTVFVEWSSSGGARRTTWLRVPPVPSRYRVRLRGPVQ
ncbi:hypothetical protein ES689_03015 [Frigoribacterium sp. ACAM 257]|uniref:hypothetical protein n=1 Tax=Frigoribacterium sp. ACAM 257 TaxID=2508998 RepID=UPI0011BA1902|nr:hypothetical protein [Frigoribacterium sp. ACAM 257]TWX40444.1 hypothetical protein ES689_03015 [Frigoribacterium sp. ACAM 257]